MRPAGKRRHRVTIQSDGGTTYDTSGQPVQSWTTFATRWAEIEPLTGRERWDAGQVRPDITHRVRMLYLAGVTPRMRIAHDGRTFNIEDVRRVPDERKIELEMMCVEAV